MKKTTSIIITVFLIAALAFVFTNQSSSPSDTSAGASTNVSVVNGVQSVTINAKGGYNPRSTTIKGGMPTKLIVKTNDTYDCSSSLVVKSANYRGMLPATGVTEIDLGTPKAGEKIQWICGMGMYSFALNVN